MNLTVADLRVNNFITNILRVNYLLRIEESRIQGSVKNKMKVQKYSTPNLCARGNSSIKLAISSLI